LRYPWSHLNLICGELRWFAVWFAVICGVLRWFAVFRQTLSHRHHRHRFITFRVSCRPREMYCSHARLCVCLYLSVRGCMPTLLYGPRCNLGEWYRMPLSCALLGGFAIGARVALLWQHYVNVCRLQSQRWSSRPNARYTHTHTTHAGEDSPRRR